MRSSRSLLAFLPLLAALAACGSETADSPADTRHLLAADVAGAVSVLEAVKAADGADVAVVGRVRDMGKGVFTLVDDSIDYCGRGADPMDTCPTPWDYCCLDQDEVAKGTIVVKAVGADGRPVAKAGLGLRELDLVAVRGRLEKQADGTSVLLAKDGWFLRERPDLGSHVTFP